MKHVTLILVLLTIGCGPLAAQTANATKDPRSGPDDPTVVGLNSLFSPSVTSLQQKQRQLNELEGQLSDLRKQIDTQNKEQGGGPWVQTNPSSGRNSRIAGHIVLPESYAPSQDLLVIPGDPANPEQISTILEDMRIMSRILEKGLRKLDPPKWQGFFSRGSGSHNIKGLYLDGYGLVFKLQVGFPLISQGQEETPEAEEESSDKVWHETRQEIFEPARPRSQNSDREEYDPERVEGLKATIAQTLKHAANIRTLKENECVAVIVTSTRQQDNNLLMYYGATKNRAMNVVHSVQGDGYSSLVGSMMGLGTHRAASVLSIKATKANIDAFASKALDLNDFRAQLQVVLY